jgi:hypothetical protein
MSLFLIDLVLLESMTQPNRFVLMVRPMLGRQHLESMV